VADQSYMIFEVREIIQHFKDGQSFNNLQSIELEPIVRVKETKEKIEITGHLVLNGEFFNGGPLKGETEWKDEFEQADGLHYGSVFYGNDGAESFQYQIPLTFEIQPEKVRDPSQIFVLVDDFDYNTLADNKLELIAQIKLVGVHPEPKQDNPIDSFSDFPYFGHFPTDNNTEYTNSEYTNFDYTNSEYTNAEENVEPNIFSLLKDNTEPKKQLDKELVKDLKNIEIKPLIDETNYPPSNKKEEKKIVKSSESQPNTDNIIESKVEKQEASAKKTINSKTTKDMLFGMLQSNEENQYKLKIYLVKKDDTIDAIARKYGVTTSCIQKYNKLEGNQLEVGQLLYLPDKRMVRND